MQMINNPGICSENLWAGEVRFKPALYIMNKSGGRDENSSGMDKRNRY